MDHPPDNPAAEAGEAPPVLQAEAVAFGYGRGDPLFTDLDLQVRKGETYAVLGPSGEGKTTLLKLLAGLLKPWRGRVLLEGLDLGDASPSRRKAALRQLGMTFQRSGLFDSLTCGDNLRFPLEELTDLGPGEIEERMERALRDVGLMGQEALMVHEMSGGMQKRLGIARALVLQPSVVLYDEPTAGLDPLTSVSILDLIRRMREKYRSTVVMVTSDPFQAMDLADRLGFLHGGRFLCEGSPEEMRQSEHPAWRQFLNGEAEGPLTDDRSASPGGAP